MRARIVSGIRVLASASLLVCTLTSAVACGSDETAAPTASTAAEAASGTAHEDPGTDTSATGRTAPRPDGEQAFVDRLARQGIPDDSAAGTTIEVGHGICRNLADGAEEATVVRRIEPVTRALAVRTNGRLDSTGVGHALVEASRATLCPG